MIEIYSKDNCSWCSKAIDALHRRQLTFIEYKLDEDFTKETLLELFPGVQTFPVVVVDGFRIGGYNELQEHLNKKNNTKLLLES